MTKTIEKVLIECQEAQLPPETWFNELSEEQQQKVNGMIPHLHELSEKEYRRLGFKKWDEEIDLLLIPAWLFPLLPDGTQLQSIQGESVIKGEDEIDLDAYYGVLTYGIPRKIEKQVSIESEGDIVKRIQIDEKLSEDVGEYETILYYRIEKETGVGIDHSTGESCAIYCHVKLQHKNPISPESYKKIHEEEYPRELAKDAECEARYIVPISKEQYEAEMKG